MPRLVTLILGPAFRAVVAIPAAMPALLPEKSKVGGTATLTNEALALSAVVVTPGIKNAPPSLIPENPVVDALVSVIDPAL